VPASATTPKEPRHGAVGTAIGTSAAFAASGASGAIVAGALGGAAAGGTSVLLYRMAGYDVDVPQAIFMGFATGPIYDTVAVTGVRLGGAVSGALGALFYGEDPWQAPFRGPSAMSCRLCAGPELGSGDRGVRQWRAIHRRGLSRLAPGVE
jgi:hypothetical protein